MTDSSDLKLFHLEDIGPHYATTLRLWRDRFLRRCDEIRALGLPETFIRKWEYYLCYCEGGFLERYLGVAHLLLTKPGCRREPILPSLVAPQAPRPRELRRSPGSPSVLATNDAP